MTRLKSGLPFNSRSNVAWPCGFVFPSRTFRPEPPFRLRSFSVIFYFRGAIGDLWVWTITYNYSVLGPEADPTSTGAKTALQYRDAG